MSRIQVSNSTGRPTITISGDFTFDVNREFRDAYKAINGNTPVVVDLSRSSYIDSAGLGMLLRLREHAGGTRQSVTVVGANDAVRSIFNVANFGQLFTLD